MVPPTLPSCLLRKSCPPSVGDALSTIPSQHSREGPGETRVWLHCLMLLLPREALIDAAKQTFALVIHAELDTRHYFN